MDRKYEFTGEIKKIKPDGRNITLHRIRATRDFGDVQKGDLGGWIESEDNLSHDGDCWIYDEAKVYQKAKVYEDAKISDEAQIDDEVQVYGFASVYGQAYAYGQAKIYDQAQVSDFAVISDRAEIYNSAEVCDNAHIEGVAKIFEVAYISGNSTIGGYAEVYGEATCYDYSKVFGYAKLYDQAELKGSVFMTDEAVVCGTANVLGCANLCGDAEIKSDNHYMTIGPIGNSKLIVTLFRNKYDKVIVKYGDYHCDSKDFIDIVKDTHGDSTITNICQSAVDLIKEQITQPIKITDPKEDYEERFRINTLNF